MKPHSGTNSGCLLVAEYEDDGADSLAELLLSLKGRHIPSVSGRRKYLVRDVEAGQSVTLSGKDRNDSKLKWDAIAKVYRASAGETLTPTRVDAILHDHPATHGASTMCALVLALRDPRRVRD